MARERAFDFVVIGSGTGAVVTAWALRQLGHRTARIGAPFPLPERRVGAGWCPEPAPRGFTAAPPPARAALVRGRVLRLPLSPADRAGLLPPTRVAPAAAALARARATAALAAFVGGGREERSYRDWVRYRFGDPLFDGVFAPYARARFGDPAAVLCGVARVVHGEPVSEGSLPPADLLQPASDDEDLVVTSVAEGRVTTEEGDFLGRVVADLSPQALLTLLPDRAKLEADAARLSARHGLEVFVSGALPDGLDEIHVFGTEDAPFYRAVRAAPGEVALHRVVEPGAPEWREDAEALAARLVQAAATLGLGGLSPGGARVRRLENHHPTWVTGHLTRLRGWTEALVDAGVEPVGRVGLVSPMSAAAIAAYAEDRLVAGASLRDCIRHHVEPPPRDPVERPRLGDLLTR